MRAVLIFGLLASTTPEATAKNSNCYAGHTPEFAREWEVAKPAWNALCDKGHSSSEALRQAQRLSSSRCMARYLPYEAKGKLPVGEAAAYCAQGFAGRARLADRTGTIERPALPPKAAAAAALVQGSKPGHSGMGPLAQALEQARVWKPEACLGGLYYFYDNTTFISEDEWERARTSGRKPELGKVSFEEYSFYFDYPSREETEVNGYRVSYGDVIDMAFCSNIKRLEGPEFTEIPLVKGFTGCLGGVPVDLKTAVDAAAKGGFASGEPFRAYLGTLPAGFFRDNCRNVRSIKKVAEKCAATRTWDEAKLRRVTGRPIWIFSSQQNTAFVDALKGRLRYIAPGALDLGTPDSSFYAEHCLEDPRAGQKFNALSK